MNPIISLAIVVCFVFGSYAYIYSRPHVKTPEGRKHLRAVGAGVLKIIRAIGLLIAFGVFVFLVLMWSLPKATPDELILKTVPLVFVIILGYWIFAALAGAVAGPPLDVQQTVERGRVLGTLEEARESLHPPAPPRREFHEVRRRSLAATFFTVLLGHRR
ncbi:MAG TPA: hypothetical protein PLX89_07205 [Verrucomicrobiota bacterium]|nr:hypothetical protein [Verrucomicrobiales bacterium]HRI12778.1 hypothetical protein [Verrucomicrobiota bacterium]